MANKFVRNITNVRNIEKQEKVTNNQNDLLSDKNHAYIRNNNEYHPLTDNVKTINGMEVDKDNNKNAVSIAVKENSGEVPFTVDGQKLTFDTGNQVKTIQGLPPEANGDFTIQIKQNEEFVPYENIDKGEVIYDLGQVVTSVNGNAPDSDGNVIVSGGDSDFPIAISFDYHAQGNTQWELTINKSIDLSTDSIIVTQYVENSNFEIEKSRISVYKEEETTTIVVNLADLVTDLVGYYEIEIQTTDFQPQVLRAIHPIYNNKNINDVFSGVTKDIGLNAYQLNMRTTGLFQMFRDGELTMTINNADSAVPPASDSMFILLPTLQGGENEVKVINNANEVVYSTIITKLP